MLNFRVQWDCDMNIVNKLLIAAGLLYAQYGYSQTAASSPASSASAPSPSIVQCLPKEAGGTGSTMHVSWDKKYVWYWCPIAGQAPMCQAVKFGFPGLTSTLIGSRLNTILVATDRLKAAQAGLVRNGIDPATDTAIAEALILADKDIAEEKAKGNACK
jgi:hypothetical protein